MSIVYLLAPIALPVVAGLVALLFRRAQGQVCAWLCTLVTALQLAGAVYLFGKESSLTLPWGAFGFEFALRLYHFSGFILLAAAGFGFLASLYSAAFMTGKRFLNQYYAYFLLTLGLFNGAILADNLIVMLFFWESLLLTLFGMIIIGRPTAYKTAVKAFIISGVTDLCMMIGIGMTIYLAGTMTISQIHMQLGFWSSVAFIFLMIGAIAKAGAMPFHSWIPDAAVDAPLPFMVLVPTALEKLLGIYFLTRISLDLFALTPLSWLSPLLMVIGCITIILADMMALIQRDFKRMLAFSSVSQVGYMILGIGTAVPAGIVGGLFHLINHALYKSCLFFSGGAVEKQAGTTDLAKLGGLRAQMPITFICFIVAAAAISGVPPFNGFFSKEMIYDGALERHWLFYAAALLGSFFTIASVLKLGHATFFGKPAADHSKVREAPSAMLVPMIILAAFCIVFGIWNPLPLNHLIQPILGEARLEGHSFAGWPANMLIVLLTVGVLVIAILNHRWGVKRSGSGAGAADHIYNAPILHPLFEKAERGLFDPYEIGLKIVRFIALIAWRIDRGIDYFYNTIAVKTTYALTAGIRKVHTGSLFAYLSWSLVGLIVIIVLIMGGN